MTIRFDDDALLPRRGGPGREPPRRPRPLLHQKMTITLPWDDDPCTLEVVVLADGAHDGDETATLTDMPELADAGWSGRMFGCIDVYFRVTG